MTQNIPDKNNPKDNPRNNLLPRVFQKLKPFGFSKLKYHTFKALLTRESLGAKGKVAQLQKLYPEASPRELAYKLVEEKKNLAGLVGGIAGSMGFLGIPMDMLATTWLQASLLAEVASVFEVNVRTARGVKQALELADNANGVHPFWRVLPKTLSGAAMALSKRLGSFGIGKALPVVSAPVSAYLNLRHLQAIGEEAIRHYDGFPKARQKLRQFMQQNP